MASSTYTDIDKASLRTSFKALRAHLSLQERELLGETLVSGILSLVDRLQPQSVLLYQPVGTELCLPGLSEALRSRALTVALPRCVADPLGLEFCEIDSDTILVPHTFRIPEPPCTARLLSTDELASSLCVVPGLSFDVEGNRLGYGKGYYDRFFQCYPGWKVGVINQAAVSVNRLPHEAHDIAVDYLVTEQGVWETTALPTV